MQTTNIEGHAIYKNQPPIYLVIISYSLRHKNGLLASKVEKHASKPKTVKVYINVHAMMAGVE